MAQSNSRAKQGSRVGEDVGHLTLTDENGEQVNLEDFRTAWLWMIFHRHLG
ncbi:MAG: hypothetical protein ACN4GW_05115 [Desulforhopalus sp.]